MRARLASSLAVLALVASGSRALGDAKPLELTPATFERVRDAIVPSPEELRWTAIPWRPTLWDALVEATGKEKPILLWAMNGHPLACT
jgi:hypothetical protein